MKPILGNASWLVFDQVFRSIIGFLVGLQIIRYLGPDQFGLLNYVLAWTSILSSIASAGLEAVLIKEFIQFSNRKPEILGTAFFLRELGGLFSFSLFILICIFYPFENSFSQLFLLIFSMGSFFQALEILDYFFQSQFQAKNAVLVRVFSLSLFSLIRLAMIYFQAPLIAFVWALTLESITNCLGYLAVFSLHHGIWRDWTFSSNLALLLVKRGLPLYLSTFIGLLYRQIDRLLIHYFEGKKELGFFSAALQVTEIGMAVSTLIFSSVLPRFVILQKNNPHRFKRELQNLFRAVALFGWVFALGLLFFSQPIIQFLYGPDFQPSSDILAILGFSVIFVHFGVIRSIYLISFDQTKFHPIFMGMGTLTSIILNILLIPSMGGKGAAISFVVSQWIIGHASCFLFPAFREMGKMMLKAIFFPFPKLGQIHFNIPEN